MKTILIVDDEAKIRRIYKNLLEKQGFAVITAKNAETAHDLLLSRPIDLVLLDINLEDTVDGAALLEVTALFFPTIPVLAASVYPVSDQQKRMCGASGYYDKADGLKVLVRKVNAVLEAAYVPAAT